MASLVGAENFVRVNPMSDKTEIDRFHHVEFYAGDSTCTYKRFMHGLGMELVSKSDLTTGNTVHASYLLQTAQARMLFTAPYGIEAGNASSVGDGMPFPEFNAASASVFFNTHGFAVRAVAVTVRDVKEAFNTLVSNGGMAVLQPTTVVDKKGRGSADMAEVKMYGDVVMRLLNTSNFKGSFLPNFDDIVDLHSASGENKESEAPTYMPPVGRYGIERFDHIVGNVHKLRETLSYLTGMTVRIVIIYLLYKFMSHTCTLFRWDFLCRLLPSQASYRYWG